MKFALPFPVPDFSNEEKLALAKLVRAGDVCGCCYKRKRDVGMIVSIPDGSICNECVELLNEMVAEGE